MILVAPLLRLCLLDLTSGSILARSQAATIVQTGVQQGLAQAENKLFAQAQISPQQVKLRLASSSAAGGLRMVTIGLVPELTIELIRGSLAESHGR